MQVGTPDYVAPEVLSSTGQRQSDGSLRPVGARGYTTAVDIWAVGVLAWELLSGVCAILRPEHPRHQRQRAKRTGCGDASMESLVQALCGELHGARPGKTPHGRSVAAGSVDSCTNVDMGKQSFRFALRPQNDVEANADCGGHCLQFIFALLSPMDACHGSWQAVNGCNLVLCSCERQ